MRNNPNDAATIEEVLEAMVPPETPAEALSRDGALEAVFAPLDLLQLVLLLAGLQTEPGYQANSVRLEWATRLALICAKGKRDTNREILQRLLNRRLEGSTIPRLEDPIEDVMVEPVCTPRGEYMILTGSWEKAGHYTETVADAFWMLPEGEPKTEALDQVFALLTLSDALVRRARISRYTVGGGTPKAELRLPPTKKLMELAAQVVFTWHDLAEMGLDVGLLAPFILHPSRFGALLDAAPGNSLLEFHPLILADEGIVVAAPGNLSTAVRARLIDAAITGGMGNSLRRNILAVQSSLVELGGLVKVTGKLKAFASGFAREQVEAISLGRYVHVLHVIDDFGDFSKEAFAMARDGDPAFETAVTDAIAAAHAHAAAQSDFQQGITFLFLGGWGSGLALALDLPPLHNWQIVVLTPHDGFVLGGCSETSLRDLLWMERQFRQVREQGFEFVDINGFLNRFQLWRNTDYDFIPANATGCEPPISIGFDSNLMLQTRIEAHLAWDRRVFARPNGGFATVMRMNPRSLFEERQPVYASYVAARMGQFFSAVLVEDCLPVWFKLKIPDSEIDTIEDAFETFKAMLEWAARVLPRELADAAQGTPPIEIQLCVLIDEAAGDIRDRPSDAEIAAAIRFDFDAEKRQATLTLAPEWQFGLRRADNRAEAELAAAVLNAALTLFGRAPIADGVTRVRAILGNENARWRHGLEVQRSVEMLKAMGLLPTYEAIPESVSALVRTGLGWAMRRRDEGAVIEGRAECRAFLDATTVLLLSSLRYAVRQFRRDDLVRAALNALQAASAEDRQWARTARALRAIHGASSDYRVSLERRQSINLTVRASTMIAELAIAECPTESGRAVGSMDLAELQAHAMLYFENADLIPAIEGGRVHAKLTISPTGIIVRDSTFEDRTVRRSARVVHEALRDQAVREYDKGAAEASDDADSSFDPRFEEAVRAEYGVSLAIFIGFAQRCTELAIKRGEGVVALARAALIEQLSSDTDEDIAALVDRLTLPARDGWEVPLPGSSARDFDLAKLDRRFSLIGRPILALEKGSDPTLMIAPGVIERCIIHNLQGASHGTLQGEFWTSRAMVKYVGTRGRLEGNRFNETVAERLRKLGLTAYPSAEPSWCFNHKKTREVEELGDFDVLALTPDGSRAWVVEAKDLKLCRTLGESARRMSEYEGRMSAKGKPDKMLRHLRRVAYAREHAADLAHRLKLAVTPSISGVLVVRAPQPMEARLSGEGADASVVMLSDVDSIPWKQGW